MSKNYALSKEEGNHYLKLFFKVLAFVNKNLKLFEKVVCENSFIEADSEGGLYTLAREIWKNTETIDKFLASSEGKELSEEDREIVAGWKGCREERFALMEMKAGRLLMISERTGLVYQVSWIGSVMRWKKGKRLPARVETVLLPYKGKIVDAGFMKVIPGTYSRREFVLLKTIYEGAMRNKEVHEMLILEE